MSKQQEKMSSDEIVMRMSEKQEFWKCTRCKRVNMMNIILRHESLTKLAMKKTARPKVEYMARSGME